ncbi:putative viral structural protein [Sulfolobus polyhedral virus 2]|uniref:Putative viral structural protein n=1 Tax=Sulfolobus polyhedral virus 2 TaxID=2493125 RepID=A0A3S8NFN0_9VIRU|nr:putative viral structural protein [Sulfolobus polyhedral virus 2]AZI76045.1 putative viral structural protein [Sulfolobus polyhedral virus 2]
MATLTDVRNALQNSWTDEMKKAVKNAYKNAEKRASQGGNYAKCLEQASMQGTPYSLAAKKCAIENNLASTLSGLWGTS